jgi:hypothetical protein
MLPRFVDHGYYFNWMARANANHLRNDWITVALRGGAPYFPHLGDSDQLRSGRRRPRPTGEFTLLRPPGISIPRPNVGDYNDLRK